VSWFRRSPPPPTLPARALAGARAGLVATVPMSGVMLAARRLGIMQRRQPPEVMVDEAAGAAGADADRGTVQAVAVAAHFAFGAAAGALFGSLARGSMPARVAEGVGFGLLVWQVSYRGWIPRVGFMPHADHDEPGRRSTMFVAHVVYGATLGALASPS
jgi:Family of unknown function (DUF6789)/Protein of unknown function (DUF1440)